MDNVPLITEDIVRYISCGMCLLCLGNLVITLWVIISRNFQSDPSPGTQSVGNPNMESPLRPPRTLIKDRMLSSAAGQTPCSLVTATPSRHSSPFTGTPKSELKIPPVTSPTFSSIYGTPRSEKVAGSPLVRSHKSPYATPPRISTDYASVISSPLPDTGSPRINRVATERLSSWTEQLRQTLSTRIDQSPLSKQHTTHITSSEAQTNPTSASSKSPATISRKLIPADAALIELGLSCKIEEIAENLRRWFSIKILQPLKQDIDDTTRAFNEAGLEHLAPQNPASFSMFSRNSQSGNVTSGSYILSTTSNFATAAKPQTLLELGQKNPQDPMVQKRLRLERYLSFASLTSHRSAVLRRINELAEDGLTSAFRWTLSILQQHTSAPSMENDDSLILMHLFCTFMDENLPSERYYDSQPFSARHFVALEDNPSMRPGAIQIRQIQRQPPHFRFIAGEKEYEIQQGVHSMFHAIVYMVEYVHRHSNGFLGVGNLASPAFDLIDILNSVQ
ncbi:hypothetical protein PSACC_02786 [Paramicrosporidium saccamoebae]|uniref:Uncharacterized protein n=1 Tax=Paramicrosporidium saccamoebae TaxID=1246581 RepID=A0A2H9TI25_9FUNG|nr:hypothetical protein PSACC_02786 [Paramicrosporidium saccamoebae]